MKAQDLQFTQLLQGAKQFIGWLEKNGYKIKMTKNEEKTK